MAEIENKVKTYNQYYSNGLGQGHQVVFKKEEGGGYFLEGTLRVYWGLKKPIQLKTRDSIPIPNSVTISTQVSHLGLESIHEGRSHQSHDTEDNGDVPTSLQKHRGSFDDSSVGLNNNNIIPVRRSPRRYNTVRVRGELRQRRKVSINGHLYNEQTSLFTPPHGTVTSVNITSQSTSPDVVKILLSKFKVQTSADEFSLFVVKDNGETKKFDANENPLMMRVMLGPGDEHAKIFIMENDEAMTVSHQVAQYLNLPEAILISIIDKFNQEEQTAIDNIKSRYQQRKQMLQQKLNIKTNAEVVEQFIDAGTNL